ncbi:LLM class flavin-dependent oxidoreductase, partial [Mycobacterium intracellulare]|uniref:LLM class flavin-dependent oxidoreductase n=1 Tax=Mycobacterium intracellulare TaxID=1767 RepID=UPI000AD50C43
MRIGLMVGSDKERARADRLAGLIDDGTGAESAGFTAFWIPQVPGYLDAMIAVTLIGQATARIEIGTAVVPIQTRHPMIMAQQALTTQIACGGR